MHLTVNSPRDQFALSKLADRKGNTLAENDAGPTVVRRPISANLRLNFYSKALSGIFSFILLRSSNHRVVDKKNYTKFAF